jgi:hypothetical protein
MPGLSLRLLGPGAPGASALLQRLLGWPAPEAARFASLRPCAVLPAATVAARVKELVAIGGADGASRLLRKAPEAALHHAHAFEAQRAVLAVSAPQMWRIWLGNPPVMRLPEGELRARLLRLQTTLGEPEPVRSMLVSCPRLLSMSPELVQDRAARLRQLFGAELAPQLWQSYARVLQVADPALGLRKLKQEFGLSDDQAEAMVRASRGRVLWPGKGRRASLQQTLQCTPAQASTFARHSASAALLDSGRVAEVVASLAAALDVPLDRARSMIVGFARLINHAPSFFGERVARLAEMIGSDLATARRMCATSPHLFGISDATLAARLQFLVHDCGLDPTRSAQVVSLSIDRRLRPRKVRIKGRKPMGHFLSFSMLFIFSPFLGRSFWRRRGWRRRWRS